MINNSKFQSVGLMHIPPQADFVGREKELNTLIELTETVSAGLGRIAVVIGEPGIGKSCLIQQWKDNAFSKNDPDIPLWIEVKPTADTEDLAFDLLKNVFRACINQIMPELHDVSHAHIKNTLVDRAKILSDVQGLTLTNLFEDRPIEENHHINTSLSAQDLHYQYKIILKALLNHLTNNQHLILVLEDLQSADGSSINLLTEMLPMIHSIPILLCLVSRNERRSNGWRLISAAREMADHQCTNLNLKPLSKEESLKLIQKSLAIDTTSNKIDTLILKKSEGNPFFINQMVQMFSSNGNKRPSFQREKKHKTIEITEIPESLQDLLNARLEQLDPESLLSLSIASVIGRSFPYHLFAELIRENHSEVQPLEQLSKLEAADIVKIEQVKPELVYQFKQGLMHQAVYTRIDKAQRIKWHQLVSSRLEAFYPDQNEKVASQLAYHYLQANNLIKAEKNLRIAGQIALDAYASVEAEAYFTQAIDICKDKPVLALLYHQLGVALVNQDRHTEAIQTWEKALPLYQNSGNSNQLAQVYTHIARSTWLSLKLDDRRKSLEICLEGLKTVEGAPASKDIAILLHETGRAYAFNMIHDQAKHYTEQALSMAEALNAYDVQVEALTTLGILPSTSMDQSLDILHRAIKISEDHEIYASASRAYNNISATHQSVTQFRNAREYALKALALSERRFLSIDTIMLKQSVMACSLWLGDLEEIESSITNLNQVLENYSDPLDRNKLNQLYVESGYHRIMADFAETSRLLRTLIDNSHNAGDIVRKLEGTRSLMELKIDQCFLESKKTIDFDIDETIIELTHTLTLSQDIPSQTSSAVYCLISTLHAIQGDFTEADRALELAQHHQDQIKSFIDNLWQLSKYNIPNVLTTLHRPNREYITLTRARLEMVKQNYDQAITHYLACIEMFNQQEAKWWEARTKLELGAAYLKSDDPEDVELAQIAIREARITFSELNIDYYINLSIEKLRQVKITSHAQVLAHKKLTSELAEAGRIQNSILPTHAPDIKNFELSGVLLAAREMSGDFYDYYQLDKHRIGIVIADVVDKGAGAALYMAMSRTLLRTYAYEAQLPPKQALLEVNRRLLRDTPNGVFLTVFFGILYPKSGQFTYVNAGHNPPIHIKDNQSIKTISPLEKTGPLLGIFPGSTWETGQIQIHPGETLVLYTDGITEAQNKFGCYFGERQLISSLKANYALEAEPYRNAILKKVLGFTGDAPRLDDITLVVLKRNPQT